MDYCKVKRYCGIGGANKMSLTLEQIRNTLSSIGAEIINHKSEYPKSFFIHGYSLDEIIQELEKTVQNDK